MTHAAAGRYDNLHGDEHLLDPESNRRIDALAEELLVERFADHAEFLDFMTGVEQTPIWDDLHMALLKLDAACSGDNSSKNDLLAALHRIQKYIRTEFRLAEFDSCEQEAECRVLNERLAGVES